MSSAAGGGVFERESVATGGGRATGGSGVPYMALSSDGNLVAFTTDANGLVAGDTNTAINVFLRDRQSGTTTRVDVAGDGTPAATPAQPGVAVSDAGCVAFVTGAQNFDPCTSATNGVFVHCPGSFVTTTTLHCATTTTTLPGGGAGFTQVETDLAMLQGLVSAGVPAGSLATSLDKLLTKIGTLVSNAALAAKTRKKRSLLQKAVKTAGKLVGRLHSRAARKLLGAGLAPLEGAASTLKQDLVSLRHSP